MLSALDVDEDSKAIPLRVTMIALILIEARMRIYAISTQENLDSFDEINKKAIDALANKGDGLANKTAIKVDSHLIELSSPLLYSLGQVRVLLTLGSTYHSSNIHDTPEDDLERVISEAD